MNKLQTLFVIVAIANLLTILLYSFAASQTGGAGAGTYFIYIQMPVLWIIAIISALVVAIRQRRNLFSGSMTAWTVLALIFCTPIPMMALYDLMH
jgi:hypothetical protein